MDQRPMIDSRIASLSPEVDPEIREQLATAMRTFRDAGDPHGAVLGVFKLLEGPSGLLSRIAAVKGQKLYTNSPYKNQLNWLKNAVGIPEDIFHDLEVIRSIRNQAAHHQKGHMSTTDIDVDIVTNLTLRILEWFYTNWSREPRLDSIYTDDSLGEITTFDLVSQMRLNGEHVDIRYEIKTEQEMVVGELPDATWYFKDREEELDRLRQLLNEKGARLISIEGRGGFGKTALMSKICAEIRRGETELLDGSRSGDETGIIYINCKNDRPTVERVFIDFKYALGSPHAEDIDDLLSSQLHHLDGKIRMLLRWLEGRKFVLVLDNLEAIMNTYHQLADEKFRTFIELCLETTDTVQILVTSQDSLFFEGACARCARKLPLMEGLPADKALSFFKELDVDGRLGLADTSDDLLERAVEKCDGIPRALELLSSILTQAPTMRLSDILENEELFTGEVVDKLVEENYSRLPVGQKRVLEALAVFSRPVTVEAVEFVLKPFFEDMDIRGSMNELIRTYVVKGGRSDDSYDIHSMDQNFAYKQVPDSCEGYSRGALHRLAGEYWSKKAVQSEEDRSWADYVAYAFENLVQAEAWDRLNQLHDPVYKLFFLKFNSGERETYENIFKRMLDVSSREGDGPSEARWLHNWAVVTTWSGELDDAEKACRRGIDVARGCNKQRTEAHLLHRLAIIREEQGYVDEAKKHLEESARVKNDMIQGWGTTAWVQYAEILHREGCIEQALELLNSFDATTFEAKAITVEDEYSWLLMRISILLPRILRLVGDYETSSGILEETRSFVKSMGARRYWRRFLYESGMSALAVTDLDKARADLEECLEISERVGLAAEFAESACAVGFLDHLGRDHSSAMYYYGLALEAGSQWTRCRCLTRMGILNLESDSLDSAEEHFVKAISACAELLEKSPRLYDIAYNLAFARLGLGESEAIKTFENAVELCCTPGVRDEVLGELQLFRRSKRPIDCLDEATGLLESRS